MSDIREAYIQAVYFKQRAWRALALVAGVFYLAGFATGVLWR